MRKLIYTSTHLSGEIILGYSEVEGWLVFFDLSGAELTTEQHASFIRKFPINYLALVALVEADKENRKIVEIIETITFDMFWKKYDHKLLSNKKKSVQKWEKMSEAEQEKAYRFLPKYFYNLMQSGIAKKHVETYLNSELWNNGD